MSIESPVLTLIACQRTSRNPLWATSLYSLIFKRIVDLILSICLLAWFAPFLGFIALLIALQSKGGVIYSQMRIGKNGKPFRCYKLRTMYADADLRLQALLQSNPQLEQEWIRSQKLNDDPRITGRLGRFLRQTSLDECPQLWNVLKGDLSLVGPRPLLPSEVTQRLGKKAEKILSVKPGLTGLWQTTLRGKPSTYEQRIALDERYIEALSFPLDLKLVFKTIPCMLLKRGV